MMVIMIWLINLTMIIIGMPIQTVMLMWLFIPTDDVMGLSPDTQNCGLRMRRECRERFPRHRLQRKPLVSDPVMHHGTCVTHVPWCMAGSPTDNGGGNVPGIPGACATRNCTYLVRGPWWTHWRRKNETACNFSGLACLTYRMREGGVLTR